MSGKLAGAAIIVILPALGVTLAGCDLGKAAATDNFRGDPQRGADLISTYGCGGCHDIPGVPNANGNIGPPLHRIGTRAYIAGFLHNSPENMAFWIQEPQKVLPGNAMPQMDISQNDARDIAAFLYTLK
jgi:cytochrome c